MNYTNLITNLEEGIFTITINRPEQLNALNEQTLSEIENAIEHAFVRCREKEILVQHLPKLIKYSDQSSYKQTIESLSEPIKRTEREVLLKVLEDVNQSRQKAAQKLGLSKATLWRKMKKHGLL